MTHAHAHVCMYTHRELGVGEMVQQLRVPVAFAEDLISTPSITVKRLKSLIAPGSGDLNSGFPGHLHTNIHKDKSF